MTQELTLQDLVTSNSYKCNQHVLIRGRARTIAKNLGWKSCSKCGYDKHIEIAHIKSINDFNSDTPISVINDITNLLPLCPNCHWEFDNGHKIKNICTCGKPLYRKSLQCKTCHTKDSIASEVVQISKEELEVLIWEKPTTHIAKDFGVSDSLVVRWCKRYGISKPPRGYWTKIKQVPH